MIDVRLRQETVEKFATTSGEAHLVSHSTWFRIGLPGSGFGFSYKRPVRVDSGDSRVSVTIRDHVMITRIAAVFIGLGFTIWRLVR